MIKWLRNLLRISFNQKKSSKLNNNSLLLFIKKQFLLAAFLSSMKVLRRKSQRPDLTSHQEIFR